VAASSVTAMATSKARIQREISMATIIFRRSNRSVMTPAGKVNTNHGNLENTATSAMSSGDLVTAEASQG